MLEDDRNRLWIGTNRGISRYDRTNGQWRHFFQDDRKDNAVILSLCLDKEGNVWAGGYASDVINIDRNDRIHIVDFPQQKEGKTTKNYIYAIAQDTEGNIWMGGIINELMRYNPASKKWIIIRLKALTSFSPMERIRLSSPQPKG